MLSRDGDVVFGNILKKIYQIGRSIDWDASRLDRSMNELLYEELVVTK